MRSRLVSTKSIVIGVAVQTVLLSTIAIAEEPSTRSSPRDTHVYSRPAIPEDVAPNAASQGEPNASPQGWSLNVKLIDTILKNTDPNLVNHRGPGGGGETSIAINPRNRKEIVITAFEVPWSDDTGPASLLLSKDGGHTWTQESSINPPPGVSAGGCPCDQTVDFGRYGILTGTFLAPNVYTSSTTTPATNGGFDWFEDTPGVAQPTNHDNPASLGNADQPWMLVNRAPSGPFMMASLDIGTEDKNKENVYVAYDDFSSNPPAMHVAVAVEGASPDFTMDNASGVSSGFVNPGHRLATDHRSGAVYSLFQQRVAAGAGGSQNINYILNRSDDGGKTWILNGSPTGIVVANGDSNQPTPKFCTVNALLGGVDHAAVDQKTADLYYVYGSRDSATGNNRLAIRRLTDDGSGGLTVGPEYFVTGQVQAAIPQVAVRNDGTLGVFYYTCDDDGTSTGSFPKLSAHFSTSQDQGLTWTDVTLLTFLSPAKDNPSDSRQRVLGDYMQTKTVRETFYGSFAANGAALGSSVASIDPIYFQVGDGN